MRILLTLVLVGVAGISSPVRGQLSAPPIPSGLPNVKAITAANSVGVLEYCASHGLVSHSASDVVIERLSKEPALKRSTDYTAGRSGHVRDGRHQPFLIAKVSSYLQSRSCHLVLEHANRL